MKIFRVSELIRKIQSILEQDFSEIWVSGEISNLKEHQPSGHIYFSLKDESALLKAVLFRGYRASIPFELENGLEVEAYGNISVYAPRGEYQIIVQDLKPKGIGSLQLAFEQMKNRLEKEGLFDPERKKEIPKFPEKLALITSVSGAAIQDILNVLKRRFASLEIFLYPTQVQGEGASKQIAQQIQKANEDDIADLILLSRGGGSLEDLWAFNEEELARAISESELPIVSAVGHEVDFTIADFVSDFRAATPSVAAEILTEYSQKIPEFLTGYSFQLNQFIQKQIEEHQNRLNYTSIDRFNRNFTRLLNEKKLSLDHLSEKLFHYTEKNLDSYSRTIQVAEEKIQAINPSTLLKRGYSWVYRKESELEKTTILNSQQLKKNDRLTILFHRGSAEVRVESTSSVSSDSLETTE